ncbi:hypothetical protein [Lyngbya confervoides]|uniref:Uncharacterized protein n=1 Tax=Lyngbya confervoides BDU141951 TaxID=1574623 RepID=A0ABD4T9J5_9CYAN|nr:hypothetical protein [Lyngbya confervoides]MCM1984995.1 hypothetical protein [Lyngbya confervoides BDU141951]
MQRPLLNGNEILALAIALCTGLGVVTMQREKLQAQAANQPQTQQFYRREERQIKTSVTLLKNLPSLGYDNLVANWAFLNFIQYFGDDSARAVTGYPVSPDFFEVVVERDPLFLNMYPYLSSSVTLFAGNPTKTIDLLSQGIEAMPPALQAEAYFLWQSKATDELLFLGDPQAARQSYLNAAQWASQSEDPEYQAIAARSRATAEFLATNPDSRNARVAAWFNILAGAIDDKTRAIAVQQIQDLGGKIIQHNGQFRITFPES